ncbi:MAG: uracil-DNA glycosylase [Prochlorococcus sp. MED-G132]|uniref:uracil-DNA glycosylase n=1 Tax=unclassified Prochlorococcus TaxID=2627481 RepID=UPI0007B37FA2|nr:MULTISPECIES: uracil-DNA glycosylase [unclassified Prochlorococcus]KZR64258.1 Uracil DNA glycosylase superfamily protein [Prochlorococcus sp. MIT 1306]KZR64368.1 Uracil DNA glycosylase superfamily protein [Prochlorococcus sp. MIT 1303]RZO51834.1 MAG: uracil-DNA glycosylase [Prochlorococcus sp. MED-G132]
MERTNGCGACVMPVQQPQVVVSRGNPQACLMVIGEAPGAREDELGKPFVGRSGQLLDRLMESVGLDPVVDAYICNVVKCRPPKNRRPTLAEIASYRPWLQQQIELVDPYVIALAGSTAVEAILGIKGGITKLRGQWQHWHGRLLMPLLHPAYLLRNPSPVDGAPIALTRGDLMSIRHRLSNVD